MTLRLNLTRQDDLCARLRQLVEEGQPDGPAEVSYDGEPPVLFVASIHRSALRTISEEPNVRFIDWTPHPHATVGPRLRALLVARDARRAAKRRAA